MANKTNKTSRKQLITRIMAWVLSLLMMGSMLTLTLTMLLNR